MSYAAGGHSKIRGVRPVNTCVDCHGAHDVGNPPALFKLSEFCGSCHGLEYLPALPPRLTRLIESSDRLAEGRRKRFDGSSSEGEDPDIRAVLRQVGDLVHRATLDVGPETVEAWIRRMK